MDIPQKIDRIIAGRKKLLPHIKGAMERAQKAKKAVDHLNFFRSGQIDSLPPELVEKLASISTDAFERQYGIIMARLESLLQRFSREEINISFVGRAGQGKSLVLQRISGLEGDVIPSADGSDCTGARSIISNSPGTETRAEITFYTEREFIDIVNNYLRAVLGPSAYQVGSVSAISNINMDDLKSRVRYDQVTETSLLLHLEKYVQHVQEIQDKLGSCVAISKNEIEFYVAQYNSKNTEQKYYTYLGVKQANILSSFPCSQCGKIVLVDTIGTGATSLGVEEEMLRTVKEDSDAVVLMMRPDALRPRVEAEDYQFIEKISRAVTPEYAKQMLFWLVNRVETGKAPNAAQIPEIMDQLKKQDLPVAQYLNVDCWRQDEVEDRLLIPVLEQLSSNLSNIDKMILSGANEQLAALEQAYHIISSRMERAIGASVNMDERRQFRHQIDRTIFSMTNQLRNLYLQREKEKELPFLPFKEAASVKLKNVLMNLPSKETIMRWLNDGTITQFNALEQLSNQLRLQIINDFLELNNTLHKITLDIKREVIHVLADEDKGKLGLLICPEGVDANAWLDALRNKLDENQFALIRSALQPLEEFDLRMENFLIYKVRCCLQPIDWSINDQPPQLFNKLDNKEALTDEIDSQLRYFLEDVHQKIENELLDFYVFPNTAIFAVLRDFHDRAAFARIEDGDTVVDQWRYLYEDMIPIIWEEEHIAYTASASRAEEWNTLTKSINECAVDGYFLIDIKEEAI